ncbi:MAG TPA: type II secretion system minor pseudopilin GspK [Thermodesulfobacteriota bacterium]|nr:type II secretion system minor pseudopilin GspK [Thermodesulfobacteriota bacterium]
MLSFKRNNSGAVTPRASERGFVLISVLLVTAVLVAVVAEFAYNVYLSTARAANFRDSQRAGILADKGVELAGAAIEELLKAKPNLTIEQEGLVFVKTEEDMTVSVRIVDEAGKVSLRTVYEKNGVENAAVHGEYSRLLKNLRVAGAKGLEDSLADWIDSDGEPRAYGGEASDYYSTLPKPYAPANRYLESTDELLMVKDYTPEVFTKISPLVSPYNAAGLINLNTAPVEVLMTLSDEMTERLARRIIEFRRDSPFKTVADIMKVSGFEKLGFELQDKTTVTSDTFRIYSRAASGEITREAEAVYRLKTGFLYWREM